MAGGSLGSLVVDISANVARFTTDMATVTKVAENTAQSIDRAFTAIKGLVLVELAVQATEALYSLGQGAIEAAASLEQLSIRTGSTVEGLANLSATARLSNTDQDQLGQGLQKLAKSMIDAANGGAKTTAAFQAIGISTAQIANQKPDEVFRLIAQRLAGYQDGAEKVALAQILMGKSGANLLLLLHDLADGGEIQSRVTAEQAKQAEQFEKNLARLSVSFHENANAMVQQFLPALSQLSENMLAAQKAGAGLLQTLISIPLKNFVAGILDTPIQERIDAVRGRIADLQDAAAHPYPGQTKEGLDAIARQAKAAKAELEGLLAQQRATALAGPAIGPEGDQSTRHLGTEKPTIKIDFGKVGSLGAEEKAARDAAIKDLDRAIASENLILTQREQFLSRYYNEDQITLEDYYAKRASAIEDNLRTVQADYAKEIAAAELYVKQLAAAQAKAPTGGPEQARLIAERTAAEEKVRELQDKSAKAASAAGLALITNALDGEQAALKQREAIESLNIELLKLQGRLEEAARAQAALSREQIPQKKLGPAGDAAAQAVIAIKQNSDLVAAKQKQISELEAHESVVEQRIALEQQTGQIGQLEGLQKLGAARQAEIADLEKLVDQYDALARVSGTPEAILAAEQLRLKLDQLKATADPLAQKFQDLFQTAFADQFAKVIDGTESVRKAFSNMAASILSELSKLASQDIARQIFGGASGSGGGGLFAGIASLLGSGGSGLAPGQAGPPASAAGGGGGGFFASLLSLLPAFAEGGDTSGSGAYLVGERGPEVFSPGQSGRVSPIAAGHTINVNIGQGASVTRDSANMIGATVARHLSRLNARNN